jgi:hypothetical protein
VAHAQARLRGEQDRRERRSEGGDDRGRDEGEVEAIHERDVSVECCGSADARGDGERVARLIDERRGEAWEMEVTAVAGCEESADDGDAQRATDLTGEVVEGRGDARRTQTKGQGG